MKRNPIAQVGQLVKVEDHDQPMKVVEVELASVVLGKANAMVAKGGGKRLRGPRGHDKYVYKLKTLPGERAKTQWFYQYEIEYVFTYMPLTMDAHRHAELVADLGGYEMLRDFLATLPHGKKYGKGNRYHRGGYPVTELIKLVEQCALLKEGDSQERRDAEVAIDSIMQ
jgi:hypothetical protein